MRVSYEKSDIISFRHAFFTRHGGVSSGKYSTLNVTTRVGDSLDNVKQNRQRALESLNLDPKDLAFLDEMPHSDKILAVSPAARGLDFNGYDAIMTNSAEVVIGMSVADCPVVMLVSEIDGVIGLAHSGWRGTNALISIKLVEAMNREYGVQPQNIKAVIGPSIKVDSYEVGHDVAIRFNSRYLERSKNVIKLNLQLAITDQLAEAGVRKIDVIDIDTYTDKRFFSYRRDSGDTGRFLVVISL